MKNIGFRRIPHTSMILLHKWVPETNYTSRYDIKLYVSSWTSREMSLHKHDKSLLSWRAPRANLREIFEACVMTFPSMSKTKHIV